MFNKFWDVVDDIGEFLTKLADYVIGGGFFLLLCCGAFWLAGTIYSAIFRAMGLSDKASGALALVSIAVTVYLVYRLVKWNKKRKEESVSWISRIIEESDGTTARERMERDLYLNASRTLDGINRELSSLESRKNSMSDQEYQRKKSELEGRRLVWQDAADISKRRWDEEAYK